MNNLRYALIIGSIVASSMSIGAVLSNDDQTRRIISDGGLAVGLVALVGWIVLASAAAAAKRRADGDVQDDDRLAAALWNRNSGSWNEWDLDPWPATPADLLNSASYRATVRSGGVEPFETGAVVTAYGTLPRTISLSVTDTLITLVRVDELSEEAGDARS